MEALVRICSLISITCFIGGCCLARPAGAIDTGGLPPEYFRLFSDSVSFFDTAARHPASGQYLDAVDLEAGPTGDLNTSVAATGMGLISLALGDAAAVLPDARDKAVKTLKFALGEGELNGKPYPAIRSRHGWFRHWFDAATGENNRMSHLDGFSVIDSTILVAGAQLAANYFSAVSKDEDGELRRLADQALLSINWESAMADMEKAEIRFGYDLETDRPKPATHMFNEYLLVACLGKHAEERRQTKGVMSEFWDRHLKNPEKFAMISYDGIPLLSDSSTHYLSSFVIQFSYYLCGDSNNNSTYTEYVANAQKADQKWFSTVTDKPYMWGLGAGETRFREGDSRIRGIYGVNSINNNKHRVVSPQIIAGFLPVYPEGLNDLLTMYEKRECLYDYRDHKLLWRCGLKDLSLPFSRVQIVDFSSMVNGLAAVHPRIGGFGFFQRYAPGSSAD